MFVPVPVPVVPVPVVPVPVVEVVLFGNMGLSSVQAEKNKAMEAKNSVKAEVFITANILIHSLFACEFCKHNSIYLLMFVVFLMFIKIIMDALLFIIEVNLFNYYGVAYAVCFICFVAQKL